MSMNFSINGQSDQIPPGFRFHPTEEELLDYYLRKKVTDENIDLDMIRDVDLNKLEPWDIEEKCKIGSTPQSDWYFFSHKDKKYPTGTRTNRATTAGFWKATGRDKMIYNGFKRIGLRKTLVFYEGRAPRGRKSDWIMHEYRLDDGNDTVITASANSLSEEGWVVCRVFKKKSCRKSEDGHGNFSPSSIVSSNGDGFLDQILSCMGKTCKLEDEQFRAGSTSAISSLLDEKFIHLPWLESPTILSSLHLPIPPSAVSCCNHTTFNDILGETDPSDKSAFGSNNHAGWVALDRLVASQLNGQDDTAQLSDDHDLLASRSTVFSCNDSDIWSFPKSPPSNSPDPLRHFSVRFGLNQ